MPKLNQIIAVVSGKKTQTEKAITAVYHKLQKTALMEGIARKYRPKEDDGDKLPPESKHVQYRASEAMAEAAAAMTELFDAIATQEFANTSALGNVDVDGKALLSGVPVTCLLFLEKQLLNITALIEKLPTLDPASEWTFNDAANCYATAPVETTRTKKIPRNHVLAEATDKHPAQVQVFHEDVVAGYWSTIQYSGAIPEREKQAMLGRVRKLQEAVKFAREQANGIEAAPYFMGGVIFKFVFGKE